MSGDPIPVPYFTAQSLFDDRVPAAAAFQLAVVLAEATEYAIESMEWGVYRKGVSMRERKRAKAAARTLILQCLELKVAPHGLLGRECKRMAYYMRDDMKWWLKGAEA